MNSLFRQISIAMLIAISVPALARAQTTEPAATLPASQPSDDALDGLVTDGFSLTEPQAIDLEKELHVNPLDLETRCKLLGYYFMHEYTSSEAAAARRGLALWMIENKPDAPVTGGPFCRFDPIEDPESYAKAKDLWVAQAAKYSQSPKVLVNAAHFFQATDHTEAEALLRQAMAADPQNAALPADLAQTHLLAMISATGTQRVDLARKALSEFTQSLSLTTDPATRFYTETHLPRVAFESGYPVYARQYAIQLLTDAGQFKSDWNYGNAVFEANLILGRVALDSGDLKTAQSYLLAAGKTPGSPQLGSFGPNMTLARDLLKAGDRKTVLAFFGECSKFWLLGKQKLSDWTTIVNSGGTPDFGANLDY